jgi:16S rRNA (cytidine1402-2'-O)-methyltransferase
VPPADDRDTGLLLVVATPIGNLDDLSPRAATAMCDADLVVAEDTRRTGRLLAHVGAETPQWSLHEHNERDRAAAVVDRLLGGDVVVLVSDAGTPAVSDPGYRLVAACVEAGIEVRSVPGPSAVLHALVTSALPTDRFAFDGFLPRSGAARRERLAAVAAERRTVVLFLSPHRAAADLRDLADACGADRRGALARELTKLHEETRRDMLGALAAAVEEEGVRGELTLVLEGASAPRVDPATLDSADLAAMVAALEADGTARKQAIAAVARDLGLPKRQVYGAVVEHKHDAP